MRWVGGADDHIHDGRGVAYRCIANKCLLYDIKTEALLTVSPRGGGGGAGGGGGGGQ